MSRLRGLALCVLLVATAAAADERAYRAYCATCHGVLGKGDGPSARWLSSPPRDFTRGEYRWRTTPTGSLPTDGDILRTINGGAYGTAMPAWKTRLPLAMRLSLMRYLKTLSPRFAEEQPEPALSFPAPPESTPELVAAGKAVYERLKCGECHGKEGRGDGPAVATMKDSVGRPMVAYDFTKGFYKRGSTPAVIYRTFMTGLNGTPMPSYEQTTREDERWPLVFYTRSLHRDRGVVDTLFGPLEEQ